MKKLNHASAKAVARSKAFDDVASYSDLENAIICYAQLDPDAANYLDRLGAAFEVYTEYFFSCYNDDTRLNVKNVTDTSGDKYNVGIDFSYEDAEGNQGGIQSKFSHDPTHKFTRKSLGTFVSLCDEMGIPAKRRKLFTNLYHKSGDEGIFHTSYAGGAKQMHVFGRLEQEALIERVPTFWSDFVKALSDSAEEIEVKKLFPPRAHQKAISDACNAFFAE
jgi:hypothetical protein